MMISSESMINYLMNESMLYCSGNSDAQWVFAQLGMQANQQPTAPLRLNLTPILMPTIQPKSEIIDDDDMITEISKLECKYENFSPNNNSLASTSSGEHVIYHFLPIF